MLLTNDQFIKANKDQHQVNKVTISAVKYLKNFVSHFLVLKVKCVNISNLQLCIMTFLWTKATDNAQLEVKFAAIY